MVYPPNPASEYTTVHYSYSGSTGDAAIEVIDMLNRTLQRIPLTKASGSIRLDCTGYAQGHYLVVLKAGGIAVKTARLILK